MQVWPSVVERRAAAKPVTCGEDGLVLLDDGANILTAIDAFRKPATSGIFIVRRHSDQILNSVLSNICFLTMGV